MKAILLIILPLALGAAIEKQEAEFDIPPAEPKSRFAMLDDVRILANGLLQLGHGLKDFVHKTKGQINEIFYKLNVFDKSFDDLSEQTNEIREKEEELKETTSRLQLNNEELKNMSRQIHQQIESLLQDKTRLQGKVSVLEEKLGQITDHGSPEGSNLKEVTSLKNFVEQQEMNIRRLLKVVQEQHSQLDHQNWQIKDLEDKLISAGFQENTKISPSAGQHTPNLKAYRPRNTTDSATEESDAARDCNDVYNRGERTSGIYTVTPNGTAGFEVYCELTPDNAWTVIQRRVDGSVDFNQTWQEYANGFGDLTGEFWLGLEKIHSLTRQADYILHIELQDWKDNKRYAEYTFTLGGHDTGYALRVSQVAGNLPSALPERTPLGFSTSDQDGRDVTCPMESSSGGWWNATCGGTNLNAKYMKPRSKAKPERRRGHGLYWKPEKGRTYSLRSTKIMLYRTDLEPFD
ncbi:angiopoietin-related protein 3 [Spea bombifrons]|uniref:angiopoietin-related protein 3 n=1 Tax=Spea bombifrons TaxID=233779 RepID=UPI00234945A6|nr:angiopoietin-related protein 3 [Spea bombifrons]